MKLDILRSFFFKAFSIDESYFSVFKPKNPLFIVSYPRSGNTLLRIALAESLKRQELKIENIDKYSIDLFQTNFLSLLKQNKLQMQLVKWHGFPMPLHEGAKLIYIHRDPKNVCKSYYSYLRYRHKKINKSSKDFIENFLGKNKDIFGSWENHFLLWKDFIKSEKGLIIDFDDLIHNKELVFDEIKKYCKSDYFNKEWFLKSINKKRSFKNKGGVDFFKSKAGHEDFNKAIEEYEDKFIALNHLRNCT
ncbi:aryl sulfotransferase [Prochlorococcus marinus str. MIT 9201]|uniref:Aryl sulfotransferase n=1 Tax=Prochlorococcus marinus str. MIT 9201 TaxID=93057 RepID=A0A0A2A8C2_PROMR|nr:sulfotransferase domain-containing protein [Prochlorococcus marinus]KGF96673.1 aryl sulfotransferase [Prochlorococcus marinus str. MIT 9201]